ncbi:septum formation family protein [Nocardioides sp. AX2bis]|uniref:septum formation family protein n=1 Tax=Nocardioides sp. AX2bis TaxID=2653157 RepID=UPI0012EF7C38|nr:septum formation family protein [Nocardioides sp. AX2bis]VXB29485.1 Septum formation [Nocardioides sp. AX2bis]
MRRPRLVTVPAAAALLLATACSGGSGPSPDPAPAESSTSAPSPSATPPPRADEVPSPEEGACYDLSYADALAPTISTRAGACDREHTAQTFATGRLDTVVDGHLLAVDSALVRAQPEQECQGRLGDFLGGTEEARRLSMLRTVWFTPTVAQSDRGAEWFRCDVIAVGADEELADLGPGLEGTLATDEGSDRYGMCGTAAPDDDAFERVVCAREHSWRAISVVELPDGDYPGESAAREAGQVPCEDAGQAVAADPAEFEWGYEWPDAEQWAAGQTYGRCWAPD